MNEFLSDKEAGRKRVVIENVRPQIDAGQFPIKRVVGEKVIITAHIFADGHDKIQAEVLYRKENEKTYKSEKMSDTSNDEWKSSFGITELKNY